MKRKAPVTTHGIIIIIPEFFHILDVTLYVMSHLFGPPPLPYDRMMDYYVPSRENQVGLDGLRSLLMTCRYMYERVGKVYYGKIRRKLRNRLYCLKCDRDFVQCGFCQACYCFECEAFTQSPYQCKACDDVACFECARWNGPYKTCDMCMDNHFCYGCQEAALDESDICEDCCAYSI